MASLQDNKKEQASDLPVRVLMVEDSENDATFLLRELRKTSLDVEPKRVDDKDEFLAALEEEQWDLILCDYNLPGFSAPEALAMLREHSPDIPFIIVSGFVGEEAAVAAMKAGARDYVSKNNLSRLGPAVLRELEESETRRQHRQLEEELRQSQKLESIGRLAGGVAHDFNNLLTVIQGYAEIGLKNNQPGKTQECFGHILDAARSAAHLTSQLLAFSRRQRVDPEIVDPNELISGMEHMLGRLINENIRLITSLSPDIRHVKVDRHQMEQVIVNMVVNARDAMPNGGAITIETVNALPPFEMSEESHHLGRDECVKISIRDTGIGMTDDVKARIFEPFFTTKEAGSGSGLGLATCYGIIKQSNGEIIANSEPGAGTCFDIWIPCTSEPAALPQPTERNGSASVQGDETILVVEDQGSVRSLAVEVLREAGYTVLEAADGVEAVKVAEEFGVWRLQMLLTDVVMPRMGGIELAERLKPQHPNLTIMFISGYARDLLDYQGTDDFWFMPKPLSPFELAQNVRQALDKAAKNNTVPAGSTAPGNPTHDASDPGRTEVPLVRPAASRSSRVSGGGG